MEQSQLPKMPQSQIMNDGFCEEVSKYNEYILNILTTIEDFDIWYERFNNKEFPREWYKLIKTSKCVK